MGEASDGLPSSDSRPAGTALIVGASRGLGLAMAADLAERGWRVIGTMRGPTQGGLHALAGSHPDRVEIAPLDMVDPDQVAALRESLAGRCLDLLFVNAGVAGTRMDETIDETTTEEFLRVMATNALAPMRVVEALQDLVPVDGTIGVMSSGQGSIANNERGGNDVYRASKAALNQLMRCHAAREASRRRALVLMAPGWIRTDLGGPSAPFAMEDAVPLVVDTLLAQRGAAGLRYVDRFGKTVAW